MSLRDDLIAAGSEVLGPPQAVADVLDAMLDLLTERADEWMRAAGVAYIEDPYSNSLAPGQMLAVLRD